MSTVNTSPLRLSNRSAGVPTDQAHRFIQLVGFFRAKAGLTLEDLADRSGIARSRLGAMERGELPVNPNEAAILAQVLRCEADELISGPAGVQVSGGAIFGTHDPAGRHLPGVRPLSLTEWTGAWKQLDAEGHVPEAAPSISAEGACPDAHPESGRQNAHGRVTARF
jgi:transcriptional regulator with XRE-family HTH domain